MKSRTQLKTSRKSHKKVSHQSLKIRKHHLMCLELLNILSSFRYDNKSKLCHGTKCTDNYAVTCLPKPLTGPCSFVNILLSVEEFDV